MEPIELHVSLAFNLYSIKKDTMIFQNALCKRYEPKRQQLKMSQAQQSDVCNRRGKLKWLIGKYNKYNSLVRYKVIY